MFKRFMWVALLTLLTHNSAMAIVFIEPTLGYATGGYELDVTDLSIPASDGEKPDIKGLNYGARGGLELGSWQLGVDYVHNQLKKSGARQDLYENYKDDFTVSETAAFLGYRFWFTRIYLGYIFSANLDKKGVDGISFDNPKGFKVGASFYAFEHMALNLEYKNVEYDPTTTSGGILNLNYNALAFLVSFPFSI